MGALDELLQDELLAHARLLADFGPNLGRPTIDTLKGSRHPNMKACRIRSTAPGDFAGRGDKGGADQKRFYRRLIAAADDRYDGHLTTLKAAGTKETKHGKKTR